MTQVCEQQKILVIDDEESICRALSTIFKDEGFETISASRGEVGLEILDKEKPSMVFLDIWMPGMDGLEVLQKIKETFPELPVVMISGHAAISTAMEATRMGASDFIEKPLELEAIMKVVHRVLGNGENEPENSIQEEKSSAGWE